MHPSRRAYVEEDEAMEEDTGISLTDLPTDHDHLLPASGRGIAPEKASAILQQMNRKKRAAAILVPTDDTRVRQQLRSLGEPITLFGEGPGDRRERLRYLLMDLEDAGEGRIPNVGGMDTEMQDAEKEEEEEFYTEGIPELLLARRSIAEYSLPRAAQRLERQRKEADINLRKHVNHRKAIRARLSEYQLFGSQIAGERPVSISRFSPDASLVAVGNFGGGIKLLDVPNLEEKALLRGHTDRIGGIAWHPQSTLGLSPDVANLATGSGDSNIHLWSLNQDTPVATLSGHSMRVARVEYHPNGQYLASASFDTTWRLWDLPTQKELLLQEGHSREVYSVAFQNDGALVASGGLDAYGRIWDLRTGRTIMVLDGHIREITGLSWNEDGYRVISSSGDGSCKVWDVRAVKCAATIGAHKGLVSDVRYYNGRNIGLQATGGMEIDKEGEEELRTEGTYFVTSGFDGNVNIFSSDDWSFIKSLSGHTGNVTSVDISQDNKWIVSSGMDRTCKLWCKEDHGGES